MTNTRAAAKEMGYMFLPLVFFILPILIRVFGINIHLGWFPLMLGLITQIIVGIIYIHNYKMSNLSGVGLERCHKCGGENIRIHGFYDKNKHRLINKIGYFKEFIQIYSWWDRYITHNKVGINCRDCGESLHGCLWPGKAVKVWKSYMTEDAQEFHKIFNKKEDKKETMFDFMGGITGMHSVQQGAMTQAGQSQHNQQAMSAPQKKP